MEIKLLGNIIEVLKKGKLHIKQIMENSMYIIKNYSNYLSTINKHTTLFTKSLWRAIKKLVTPDIVKFKSRLSKEFVIKQEDAQSTTLLNIALEEIIKIVLNLLGLNFKINKTSCICMYYQKPMGSSTNSRSSY